MPRRSAHTNQINRENSLRALYLTKLRDLFDAENRLVRTLPKLAKAANSADLRIGIESHLRQTEEHLQRLKQIFAELGEKPAGQTCKGMMGVIQEGDTVLHNGFGGVVKDAALISAAQEAKHYEIAGYGCVRTWAELLGESDASALLQETLQEEKAADARLTELAEKINMQANQTLSTSNLSGAETDMAADTQHLAESAGKKPRVRAHRGHS